MHGSILALFRGDPLHTMSLEEDLARYRSDQGSVLTIGTFDGVHKGHEWLVRRVTQRANDLGLKSIVLTFDKIPRTVIRPNILVPYLSTLPDRLSLLQSLGVDMVASVAFTRELSQLTAEQFMSTVVKNLHVKHFIIGPGFALGRNRAGDFEKLREIGQELGYSTEMLEPYISDHSQTIRSTKVREMIAQGMMEQANELLGRSYALSGIVYEGHKRGKDLGFPTANIDFAKERAIPPDGVYVTRAFLESKQYLSVTNIGDNPTFGDEERCIEVHILDFTEDIYGAELKVEFVQRLREEIKFESVESLVSQMHVDVNNARAILGHPHE